MNGDSQRIFRIGGRSWPAGVGVGVGVEAPLTPGFSTLGKVQCSRGSEGVGLYVKFLTCARRRGRGSSRNRRPSDPRESCQQVIA